MQRWFWPEGKMLSRVCVHWKCNRNHCASCLICCTFQQILCAMRDRAIMWMFSMCAHNCESDKNKYGKACSDKGSNKRSERESEMVGRAFNSGKRVSAYVCTWKQSMRIVFEYIITSFWWGNFELWNGWLFYACAFVCAVHTVIADECGKSMIWA